MGTVSEVWRYPVKSMMGERRDAIDVTTRGVVGDRWWAARDEVRGGIRGAKKIGGLMRVAARWTAEPSVDEPVPHVELTFEDGTTATTADADINARVSKAVDHEITLWPLQPATDLDHYRRGPWDSDDIVQELREFFDREPDEPLPDLSALPAELVEFESPPGTYVDAYPLLLLTTTSLRRLAELAPDSIVDVRRFRPNVLIDDVDGDDFPEQGWIGRRVRAGDVLLEVVAACPRCVMITRPFADLPQDRRLSRTVVKHADQNLGVYATVVEPGRVAIGDTVTVE